MTDISEFEGDYGALFDPPSHGQRYVNIYSVDRFFGGPEEGGWWYDAGEPVGSIPCRSQAEADEVKAAMLVRFPRSDNRFQSTGGSDYVVTIEDEFAAMWPTEKPHYE